MNIEEQKKELEGRFQNDQEVPKVSGTEADTGDQSFNISETKRSGSKLKQEIAAQVVAQGKGTSGIDSLANPSAYGKVAGSYSGDGVAVLGNFANTPVLREEHQGHTREGKKLSDANKDINLMASEQYATYFEQPKALAQDRDSTVGYNGNPSNISARAQKNSGFTPAELTFDRSLDEIKADFGLFISGQVVRNSNITPDEYPTKTFYDNGPQASGVDINLKRSNYMPHAIKASFTRSNGLTVVSSFEVIEDEIPSTTSVHEVLNDASACHVIDVNRAEIARQAIDNDHGSPTSSKYNPLGRSVKEPSATMLYLMDVEQVSGAIITATNRFANKAKSYYLNRVGKDGITQMEPVIDALYGHIIPSNSSKDLVAKFSEFATNKDKCPYFSTELNKLGSAAVLLQVFDSLGKYKTKADVVNQPRGLKLPLSTGINNITPFHVSEDFIKALNAIDVFSTIDRGYDPSAPVIINDGMAYVLPYSWRNALKFTREEVNGPRIYGSKVFAYAYMAGQGNQKYYVKVGEPVLNGIAWFLEQYASSFFEALGGSGNETVTIEIPVRSYSNRFSLFDYLVCASSAYILYERTNSLKDILDEEQHTGYPFPHMKGVSKADILNPSNYGAINSFDRLSVKEAQPASAMRWIMPEVFTPVGEHYLLPWYNAQSDFEATKVGTIKQVREPSHFPAPVIRSGVALAYLDDFYGMSLKDQLLCIDKMVTVPGKNNHEVFDGYFYKYGKDSEGLVITEDTELTTRELLSTPRQIGWTFLLPDGLTKVSEVWFDDSGNVDNGKVKKGYFSTDDFLETTSPYNSSFSARAYSGYYGEAPTDVLSVEVVAINRGQAFAQKWDDYFASTSRTNSQYFPVMMSLADGFTNGSGNELSSVIGKTSFRPFEETNGNPITSGVKVFALMRALWARIQKLPFIINPFDAGASSTAKGKIDPFDFAYMFGLAGFMSVTYFEEMSNRMSDKYSRMFQFTEDPYQLDSPLYK